MFILHRAIAVSGIGYFSLFTIAMCVGAVVFAHYSQAGCGPLEAGVIHSPNQVMVYQVTGQYRKLVRNRCC